MLDFAVADNRLARNPAVGVRLPRLGKTEQRYLTHGQVAELADACGGYKALILTLAYCGLRWGEVAGLRVRRVDLLRGRLIVAETMVEVHGKAVFGPPKTHQERSVPVPRFLRELLASEVVGKGPDDLVFTSPRAGVLRVGNFRRGCWDRACVAVGLGKLVEAEDTERPRYVGLHPHELRHTAASLAIAAGASIKSVQRMLGHASAAMTLDRYGHLFDDELDGVADRLDTAARVSQPCHGDGVVELRPGAATA
ncbi:MAG: tyrosine-type recombinase/integrase [Acidimicrobiales bacterium]